MSEKIEYKKEKISYSYSIVPIIVMILIFLFQAIQSGSQVKSTPKGPSLVQGKNFTTLQLRIKSRPQGIPKPLSFQVQEIMMIFFFFFLYSPDFLSLPSYLSPATMG